MKTVKFTDGRPPLSFPDTMADDEIKNIIKKKFPSGQAAPSQSPAPAQDQQQQQGSSYQDFMNPQKTDSQGRPMIETFLGRMPKDMPEFKGGTPENKQLTEDMINSAVGSPGIQSVVQAPFKLSLKNIVKGIIESKNKEKLYHSTEYNKIWNAAKDAGVNDVTIDYSKLGFPTLMKAGVNSKYIRPLKELMINPTLENAQKAQSDLGKFINSQQLSKEVLTSEENAAKEAAIKAQEHIKDMMFRDKAGQINQPLKDAYTKISESYGKNFKPYDIPAIKKYEAGKMTAKQLMTKLKNGEFMAQKGAVHPEIERRDTAIDFLKHTGVPLGIGAIGATGGSYLLNKLLGKND